MSWQAAAAVASMAASGVSMASSMSAASARGGSNRDAMTAQGNSMRLQAGQLRDQANEVDTQVAIEEAQRLSAYASMMAGNRAGLATQGISDDGGSVSAVMRQNQDAVGQDLLAVKYMGSAKASRLRASAKAADDAADVFYKGGIAAQQQGETESMSRLAGGAWNMLSSMPNMVKTFGSFFGGGGGDASGTTPGGVPGAFLSS